MSENEVLTDCVDREAARRRDELRDAFVAFRHEEAWGRIERGLLSGRPRRCGRRA